MPTTPAITTWSIRKYTQTDGQVVGTTDIITALTTAQLPAALGTLRDTQELAGKTVSWNGHSLVAAEPDHRITHHRHVGTITTYQPWPTQGV